MSREAQWGETNKLTEVFPMVKEVKLVNKVKRLIRRLGCPRFLNRYGPKKYEVYVYLSCLLIRHFCQLSYRRLKKLLDLLDITCPSKSALQYNSVRIPSWLWNRVLDITSGMKHHIVALDGTGFSRTNPSYYYLRRIDGKMPKVHVKLSAALDTKNKKWCKAKVRIIPRHDMKDAKHLIKNLKTRIIVADKGYDANSLHKYCYENKIETHIPLRDYGKTRRGNMGYRKKASKRFRLRSYNRRVLIESGFSSVKRKYGASVNSKTASGVRAEIYGRLVCHNLFGAKLDLGQSP